MIDLLQIRSHESENMCLLLATKMRDRIRIGVIESRRWDSERSTDPGQRITNSASIVAALGVVAHGTSLRG